MRRMLKRIAAFVLIPLTRWYLSRERKFTYRETTVTIQPGVFHPGFFSSTTFILNYVLQKNLAKGKVLELGCGSGLISIMAAKAGAEVTACDLSVKATKNTEHNARANEVDVNVINSNIFDNLQGRIFDCIVINPPYYAREIKSEEALAWHCGEGFEYFHKLFHQLPDHIHSDSEVLMVLTKGCDLKTISSIGHKAGFEFKLLAEKDVLFDEKDYLYKICPFKKFTNSSE